MGLLALGIARGVRGLRVLLVSQPDQVIEGGIGNLPVACRASVLLDEISRGIIDKDIFLYLSHNL
jgi:hypothetical protein